MTTDETIKYIGVKYHHTGWTLPEDVNAGAIVVREIHATHAQSDVRLLTTNPPRNLRRPIIAHRPR